MTWWIVGAFFLGGMAGMFLMILMAMAGRDDRICTCHPDDNPPRPCPRKYALTECRAAREDDWKDSQ